MYRSVRDWRPSFNKAEVPSNYIMVSCKDMISGNTARQLTSTIRKDRDNALVALFKSLDTTLVYSERQWLDFFKVIFYHFWLSDKQYVQHHLADVLSEQLLNENSAFSFDYLKYFWVYMSNEWHGLDMYRLDKYYDLFRRMHLVTFKLLHTQNNESVVFHKIMSILRGELGPLGNDSLDLPDGLRFHTLEVLLDEFCKSCSENEELDTFPISLLNIQNLFCFVNPILEMFKNTKNVGVYKRIVEDVLYKLLELLADVDHADGTKALQFYVNVLYSFPTHSNLNDDKRQVLFDLVKKSAVAPEFIEFTGLEPIEFPELVHEADAENITKEFDNNLPKSREARVIEGEKLEMIKEIRTLWRVGPKSNSKVPSDAQYPIDGSFAVVPKANYAIPELDTLHKCKHSKNVHFKLKQNKIKHFNKRQPPSFISK